MANQIERLTRPSLLDPADPYRLHHLRKRRDVIWSIAATFVVGLSSFVAISSIAQATPITYNWITTEQTSPIPFTFAPELVVDSSVLSTGLDFSQQCALADPQFCFSVAGDSSGFISLSNSSFGYGNMAIQLTFNVDGTLTGSIDEDGFEQNLHLAGSGVEWSTTSPFFSDRFPFCGTNADPLCQFEGYWLREAIQVPEPASMALLGTAMLISLVVIGAQRRIL